MLIMYLEKIGRVGPIVRARISRKSLYEKMKKYNIVKDVFKNQE
jgi:DNA-binding NtrC family response regulator